MIERIRNPAVFAHPAVAPWLAGVCRHFECHASASAYIADLCVRSDTQVLLGIEDAGLHALLITQLPCPLLLIPTVLLGYNTGSRALGREMVAQAAAWCREHGYERMLLANRSGRSDAAYARGLRRIGMVKDSTTVFEVEPCEGLS